ncbi:MAG: TRAP transporter TatT component family protein [Treponema sp.]|nr:TRAP transporter TatT component family protein [Treponema sp.]
MKRNLSKSLTSMALLCLILLLPSCAINRVAINLVSNALTGEGSADVFTSDPDPELVGAAIPFAIKLYETLLAQNPNHQGLLLTTGSLFIMYANAFVHAPAQMMDPIFEYHQQVQGLDRAKALYIRGYEILVSALDKKLPGFSSARAEDGTLAPYLARLGKDDVPLLYWTVAGGLSAYSMDLFDFSLGSRIPEWEAMMARAYELDPNFNTAAIDEFYVLFYAALPENMGGDRARAEWHFNQALEKTQGLSASTYVSWAMVVNVSDQDYESFQANLYMALAIDPDEDPSTRLLNILAQRRARHLLETAHEHFFFLPFPGGGGY